MPKHFSSGPIVTARASILDLKSDKRLSKVIRGYKSSVQGSATRKERKCLRGLKLRNASSNMNPSHIVRAAQNPVDLDDRQVTAVAARIEIDLRLGAAFTRYQTLTLQGMGGDLAEKLISYGQNLPLGLLWFYSELFPGSCQFPTLGFVVDRYFRVKNFIPEKFWSIKVDQMRDDVKVQFSWRRNRLFDRGSVIVIFERCLAARTARVSKMQKKPTSKWRPLPLTTVELQKLGSMYLRMDSQKVMKVRLLSDSKVAS